MDIDVMAQELICVQPFALGEYNDLAIVQKPLEE